MPDFPNVSEKEKKLRILNYGNFTLQKLKTLITYHYVQFCDEVRITSTKQKQTCIFISTYFRV